MTSQREDFIKGLTYLLETKTCEMMKKIISLTFLIMFGFQLIGQNDEKDVQSTIATLFDGMRAGDSSMVHSVFMDNVRMFSSTLLEDGTSTLRTGNLNSFLLAVGSPHDEVWDENIWNLRIDIDDHLAHAWMDYTFYAGDRLSHCGVNAMQLVKSEGSWKIIHLIDTRKKVGCKIKGE